MGSYARLATGRTPDKSSSVIRRHRNGDVLIDEAFTHNLRWESTDYFDWVRVGYNDDEHVEISEAETQQFIDRIRPS